MNRIALAILAFLPCTSILNAQSTYTGIQGYYDYQTSYRSPQYIRCSPGFDTLHAIMMVSYDSLNPSSSRRTAYAFSSNGGTAWTTFNNLSVPDRRSGFPSLDIGKGAIDGAAIVANHGTVNSTLQSSLFVDFPPGSGAFGEIPPPLAFGGSDEPIFADAVGAADGSVTILASRAADGSVYRNRTPDFISWGTWSQITSNFTSDGFVGMADASGRVGIVIATPSNPIEYTESTNNGVSWSPGLRQLLPEAIPAGTDTFVITQGLDFVVTANGPLVTFGTTMLINGLPTQRFSGIGFYSDALGFVLAVPHSSIPIAADTLRKRQVNQNPIGYPAIGISGNTIVIAFQVFRAETSAAGFNYADIFLTYSTNQGSIWSQPVNCTSTTALDERYPSMAKVNPANSACIVYQEDPQPGSAVFGGDNSPMAIVRQVFNHVLLSGESVDEGYRPKSFALRQNYPNPFNPTTTLAFEIPERSLTTLTIVNLLGQTVATLLHEERNRGSYEIPWNASGCASGLYVATLTAGQYRSSRKLLLLR
jgi:hypothetical protein